MALLLFILCFTSGYMDFRDYWDARCLIAEIGICFCLVLICGARTKLQICTVIRQTAYPSAVVILTIEFVAFLTHMTDLSQVGPSLAVIFLSLLYASILYLNASIAAFVLERELNQKN